MKNIIIVGDSFCSDYNGWPGQLANQLNLNLICHGVGGQGWWNGRLFLQSLSQEVFDHTESMVFVHTNSERIANRDQTLGQINHSEPPQTEKAQAIQLYFKYIFDPEFMLWAQQSWIKEIEYRWSNKKIVHLHSFPWTETTTQFTGMEITPNLCAISLNELGADTFNLFNDSRSNHLNTHNNRVLADQLASLIKNYSTGKHLLDINQFEQLTLRWLDWH